jgi:hypothetical protein
MLQLPRDLGFLDEAVHQVAVVFVAFEQYLDSQVAAEVGVAALEDNPHTAAGDLAQDLQPGGRAGMIGRRVPAHPDDGRLRTGVGVPEEDAWDRADGDGD